MSREEVILEWSPSPAHIHRQLRAWKHRLPLTLLIYAGCIALVLLLFWAVFQQFRGAAFPWDIAWKAAAFAAAFGVFFAISEGYAIKHGSRMRITESAIFRAKDHAVLWKHVKGYWFEPLASGDSQLVIWLGGERSFRFPLPDPHTEALVRKQMERRATEVSPPVMPPIPANAILLQSMSILSSTLGGGVFGHLMAVKPPFQMQHWVRVILSIGLVLLPLVLLARKPLGPSAWRVRVFALAYAGLLLGMVLGPLIWLMLRGQTR